MKTSLILSTVFAAILATGCANSPNRAHHVFGPNNYAGETQATYAHPSYPAQNYGYADQYGQPQYLDARPNYLGGLGGAVIGGLLGSQVGKGKGRTAAVAFGGAMGSIVGAGCRATARAAAGAIAGGALASKIGKGRGRRIAIAMGAGAGAAAASDCY